MTGCPFFWLGSILDGVVNDHFQGISRMVYCKTTHVWGSLAAHEAILITPKRVSPKAPDPAARNAVGTWHEVPRPEISNWPPVAAGFVHCSASTTALIQFMLEDICSWISKSPTPHKQMIYSNGLDIGYAPLGANSCPPRMTFESFQVGLTTQ